ncbi:uncharacterized protein J3D65DRAFT_139858 [Phyllosticta citribraziliensis]|uniref:Uncharacterized protein n=1 Tax=Phyllosticta citribraziliensis TaxID=989973 RepID=A0ABR1LAM0_9PEZI
MAREWVRRGRARRVFRWLPAMVGGIPVQARNGNDEMNDVAFNSRTSDEEELSRLSRPTSSAAGQHSSPRRRDPVRHSLSMAPTRRSGLGRPGGQMRDHEHEAGGTDWRRAPVTVTHHARPWAPQVGGCAQPRHGLQPPGRESVAKASRSALAAASVCCAPLWPPPTTTPDVGLSRSPPPP